MVHAVVLFAVKRYVHGIHSKMLEERRVVRTGPQRAQRQFGARIEAVAGFISRNASNRERPRLHGGAGFRVFYVARRLIDEMLQSMAAFHIQRAAGVHIRIYVQHRLGLEFRGVGFDPFGRTEQSRLFSVPTRIDQGALRLPSFPDEPPYRLCFGHQRHVSRKWIGGAEHPGIVMIAADDPMIRLFGTADSCDDVVDRLLMPIGKHLEMDFRGPGSEVVSERQGAAPGIRRHRPAERTEQRFGVRIGNRQHRNFQDRPGFVHGEPLGSRGRTGARRERVAAVQGEVLDRAPLHAVAGTITASRISVAGPVAVIAGIRIDQATDGAMFVRELRFSPRHPPP